VWAETVHRIKRETTMSLPGRNEKCYLEVTDHADGFAITALGKHANELQPLFHQYGMECRREAGPKSDTLVFGGGTDRAKVEEVLASYETSRGS